MFLRPIVWVCSALVITLLLYTLYYYVTNSFWFRLLSHNITANYFHQLSCRWLPDTALVEVNEAFCSFVGLSRAELIGRCWTEFMPEHYDPNEFLAAFTKQNLVFTHNNSLTSPSGETRWFQWSNYAINRHGRLVGVHSIAQDITRYKAVERDLSLMLEKTDAERTQALMESEQRYRILFETAADAILITDMDGHIIGANNAASEISGYSLDELLKLYSVDLVTKHERERFAEQVRQLKSENRRVYETEALTKDGNFIPIEVNARTTDLDGQLVILSLVRDISSRKQAEEKIIYVGMHDNLTKLYNRTYFEQYLNHLEENRPACMGVLVCDVDGLKFINDTLGHMAGDKLLRDIARIICAGAGPQNVVARIGGDEFAILAANATVNELERINADIRAGVEDYSIKDTNLPVSISLGFARGRNDYNIPSLFKQADDVMYREKLYQHRSYHSSLVQTLMQTLEARDLVTQAHVDRMLVLVNTIGRFLNFNTSEITKLCLFAQFHDIGKIGIPDRILFKPGPLDPDERQEMQRHSEIGSRIALASPDLKPLADFILKHHERWNGQGYPFGLKGEDIPLECRILSIIDAYDALTSDRPYRKAMSHEIAMAEIVNCSGVQFDPELVANFQSMLLMSA
jgi:diguanylate cyclase (GGDEF)-like protein/PAS domain S-box-containing protein